VFTTPRGAVAVAELEPGRINAKSRASDARPGPMRHRSLRRERPVPGRDLHDLAVARCHPQLVARGLVDPRRPAVLALRLADDGNTWMTPAPAPPSAAVNAFTVSLRARQYVLFVPPVSIQRVTTLWACQR
jgi:hypothetical protein